MRDSRHNKWINQIDETTRNFREAFGSLDLDQLNMKPDPQTWSIGQNIDHLMVINRTYFPIIQSVREGTYQLPFIAGFGFLVNLSGKMILKSVQPDRRKKMKTFAIWEPSKSEVPANILEEFEEHQEELKHLILDSMDLVDKGTIISSPANRHIVYKLETAFDIIVAHERRHLEQAREVLEILK